jgi:hypothetical protein
MAAHKGGNMTTFNELISKANANHNVTRRNHLVALFTVFLFVLIIYPGRAHAQVIGSVEANIPFSFQAGNAQLPPGDYSIRMVENSNLTYMQITSKDGSSSAMFQVHETDLSSAPAKTELIFNKYGDHYFLAQVFDEGDPSGSQVVESSYEHKVSKAAAESKVHVATTQQRQQQGD